MKSLLAGFTSHFYGYENKPRFKTDFVSQSKIIFLYFYAEEIMFVILCKETVKLRNNIRIKA